MNTSAPFKPYVDPKTSPKEFTFRSLLLGILLGLLFGVGNAYLGLRIGMTISASIPAAVLSMAIFHLFFRNVSILENNIVQTIATVGEGLAAGMIFTVPALYFLGDPLSQFHIVFLSILGGILGVLFMIPMRRYIIVQEHGILPFPEGTACAEILKAKESGEPQGVLAGMGIGIGALYKACTDLFHLWKEKMSLAMASYQNATFSMDCTPALLGVGFIIGPRIAMIMLAGGALGWWALIPLIKMCGAHSIAIFPSDIPIADMSSIDIWSHYIRYIGAGAVVVGGLFGLGKIAPLILKTFHAGFKELFQGFENRTQTLRTEKDISLSWLIVGSALIILTLWLFPGLPMNFLTVFLLTVIGFFFVAVTSITVGLVGSSSNPVSGMTITTLLITCLIFVTLGWTERVYLIAAMTMACVANIAICLAATTSQDLKTGFLLGATPKSQQIAEIFGLIIPSVAIAGTIYLLHQAYGLGSDELPAPQATLMSLIAKSIIHGNLPTTLVGIGAILGLVMALIGVPILPFAIGLYLPLSLTTAIAIGGIIQAIVKHFSKGDKATQRGILTASGLVAGDACMGVIIALFAVLGFQPFQGVTSLPSPFSVLFFLLLGGGLIWFSLSPPFKSISASKKP